MSEFKGTKGKWFYSECSHQMDNDNTTIHGFSGVGGHVFSTAESHGDNKELALRANALLISKAPEILDMLKRLRNDYGNYVQNILQESHRVNRINEIEQLIKEATEI